MECIGQTGAYPALSEIDSSKANSFTQVIGVVAKVEPIKRCRTNGQFSRIPYDDTGLMSL